MAQPFPIRRAAAYRQRAHELSETAKHLRDECDRRHMLDQAATFQAYTVGNEARESRPLIPLRGERPQSYFNQ